jgi:hypothetical protein
MTVEQYEQSLEEHIDTLQSRIGDLEDELEDAFCKLDTAEVIINNRDELLLQIATVSREICGNCETVDRAKMMFQEIYEAIEAVPSFNEIETNEDDDN